MRIPTRIVPVLCLTGLLATASRADAFCPNDEWGSLTPGIVGTSQGVVLIWGDANLYHYGSHPNCFGYFTADVSLSGWSCAASDLNQHVPPEGSESVSASTYCYIPCGWWATANAEYTWNGSFDYEFAQSNSIRQPCDCSPPPGGCQIEGCIWSYYECDCVDCCPLVFDTSGLGYKLTSADLGVWFDINADGRQDAISWTDPTKDVAFLTFDRNSNRRIDHGEELFGNVTPLPGGKGQARHGFDALRSLESPQYGASVADGVIDDQDAAYHKLLLWKDANHDGVSQANELTPAALAGLVAIETRYRNSRRVDEFGNEYRLRGISWWQRRGRLDPRLFYDVWFVPRR